jgi:hypothetical protein
LSTSDADGRGTDFDRWIGLEYSRSGAFTALAVLVAIEDSDVKPLCSTYFNVIGAEVEWQDILVLFAGAGMEWDGAALFIVMDESGGPVDNPTARMKLRELEARLDMDRLVLNEGSFFDKWGRRLRIDEMTK